MIRPKKNYKFSFVDQSKGGHRRAMKLTPAQRKKIAQNAAVTRWKNKEKVDGPR